MKYFVTGGAGFIGSNLVDRLLSSGDSVVVYDNLSTGFESFLDCAKQYDNFKFIKGDTLDLPALTSAMNGCDFVFHLAANADVRFGLEHPRKDLEQNTIATFNVLEAMRASKIKNIAFSSTGSIYGEPDMFPTPEDYRFPIQTSLYGASKLACEGLIQAYAEGFNFHCYIFRFVSILGERYTHGHIFDFYKNLRANPSRLDILGDGSQRKSYLHIQDCISAMLLAIKLPVDKVAIYNLGTTEYCTINESISWITKQLNFSPVINRETSKRGWIGDSPFILLDTYKIRYLGWTPKLTIKQSVIRTLEYLRANPWVLERK
jgi:UDP-glucose 4-epimerase